MKCDTEIALDVAKERLSEAEDNIAMGWDVHENQLIRDEALDLVEFLERELEQIEHRTSGLG